MLPLVAVIFNEYLPDAVFLAVAIVNPKLPEVFTELGLKTAVAPAGNPLTFRVTVPVKVPVGLTVTV